MDMILGLPPELINKINDYVEPTLEIRCVNRKYLKKYNPEIKEILYPYHFYAIDYLHSLRVRPTYEALCLYFPKSYWYNDIIPIKVQCEAFTRKGFRCTRHCYGKFCHQHKDTLNIYKNSKMFHYLTNGVPTYYTTYS